MIDITALFACFLQTALHRLRIALPFAARSIPPLGFVARCFMFLVVLSITRPCRLWITRPPGIGSRPPLGSIGFAPLPDARLALAVQAVTVAPVAVECRQGQTALARATGLDVLSVLAHRPPPIPLAYTAPTGQTE